MADAPHNDAKNVSTSGSSWPSRTCRLMPPVEPPIAMTRPSERRKVPWPYALIASLACLNKVPSMSSPTSFFCVSVRLSSSTAFCSRRRFSKHGMRYFIFADAASCLSRSLPGRAARSRAPTG
eukprot:2374468-Alexandrium_andersonii.AAC.1